MSRRRAIRRLRSCCLPLLAVATVIGLLIGTVGFSVVPPRLQGAAFPCQGGMCGCRSANDCWLGCCCLTPAQRLAWAKANGVTPPPGLQRLIATDTPPATSQPATPVAACCGGPAKPSCCTPAEPVHGEPADCCESSRCEPAIAESDSESDTSTPAFQPSRCRGPGHWWVAGGQPLALPERPATAALPTGSEPVVIGAALYAFEAESPPTRPG